MNNYIYYGNELYHYGVPGQKWGKRNYQNEDGSYTPEGQAENNGTGRYNQSRNRGKDNSKLAPYIGAAIGAAALVGAGIAVYIYADKHADFGFDFSASKDFILKKSQLLQRVSPISEKELNDVFYASFGKHDNQRYRNFIPEHYKNHGEYEVNIKKLALSGDIKIAGHETAQNVFKEYLEEDPNVKNFCIENGLASYSEFNEYICARNYDNLVPGINKIYTDYFDKLKSLGYGGLIDINDQDNSGYNAKLPLVLFNNNNFSVKRSKVLNYRDYVNSGKRAIEESIRDMEDYTNSGKKYYENGAKKVADFVDTIGKEPYLVLLGNVGAISGSKIGNTASNSKKLEESKKWQK